MIEETYADQQLRNLSQLLLWKHMEAFLSVGFKFNAEQLSSFVLSYLPEENQSAHTTSN